MPWEELHDVLETPETLPALAAIADVANAGVDIDGLPLPSTSPARVAT